MNEIELIVIDLKCEKKKLEQQESIQNLDYSVCTTSNPSIYLSIYINDGSVFDNLSVAKKNSFSYFCLSWPSLLLVSNQNRRYIHNNI